jgi:hypothetical protein
MMYHMYSVEYMMLDMPTNDLEIEVWAPRWRDEAPCVGKDGVVNGLLFAHVHITLKTSRIEFLLPGQTQVWGVDAGGGVPMRP